MAVFEADLQFPRPLSAAASPGFLGHASVVRRAVTAVRTGHDGGDGRRRTSGDTFLSGSSSYTIEDGQAYKKGVIHRDVSAGNVLIYIREIVVDGQLVQERVGILTDWELSKRTDAPETARQPDPTGTWKFMSAYTLDHLNEPICIADEIEGFFHVLLFYAIRYLRHNIYDVGDFMHTYFDGFERGNGEYYCGEKKRTAMNHGVIRVAGSGRLTFALPPGFTPPAITGSTPRETHILNDLIASLLELFRARYTLHELSKPAPPLSDAGVHPNQASAHTSTHRGRFAGMRQDLAVLHGSNLAGTARLQHVRPKVTPEERAQLETLAAQLHNHKEIEYLYASFFVDEVLQQWPLQDAVPDQLPKDYRPKNDAHEATSATSRPVTGSKRTVTEDEGDREQQEPKCPARVTRASGKAQLDCTARRLSLVQGSGTRSHGSISI